MNFLVLGSSGFIGKNLCEHLHAMSHNVFEFDIEIDKNQDLRIVGNEVLVNLIKKSDFIFFLAFDVGGAKYLSKKNKDFNFISDNLKILSNTFEILNQSKKRFVFISSYQIYKPDNSYAVTKLLGEHLSYSIKGLVVRLYNVYGEEKVGYKSHVIPDLIEQAVLNGKITLATNGNEKRQFLHVEDCCKGLYSIFFNFDLILEETKVLDLTSFNWLSIRSIAKLISRKVKCEIELADNDSNFSFMPKPNKIILKYWNPETSIDIGLDKILKKYNL